MTPTEYRTLLLDVQDGVGEITLNRPDAANALNLDLARELHDAVLRLDADSAVRAAIITGSGRFFCAGGDLKDFSAQGGDMPRYLKMVAGELHMAISRFNRMDAPVVIAVNGAAAGAGFSLALAGDFAIAGESVKLTMAYTRAGLTPDGSSTYFLPRLVGPRRARELVLTNRTLTAAEALDWGLITRVVPDAEVLDAARALAQELAHGPTRAYGLAKRLLDGSLNASLETAMEDEAQAIAAAARTADAREGMRAFIEKRQPTFKGE
jgi:2-(1,2-epoxy-1,2-dihydrophenyl)acetyl-CoA isomerase